MNFSKEQSGAERNKHIVKTIVLKKAKTAYKFGTEGEDTKIVANYVDKQGLMPILTFSWALPSFVIMSSTLCTLSTLESEQFDKDFTGKHTLAQWRHLLMSFELFFT